MHGHYRTVYTCGHAGPGCGCAPDDVPVTRLSRECFECAATAVKTQIKNEPHWRQVSDFLNREPDPLYHAPRGPKVRKTRSDKGVPRPHRRKKVG